MWRTARRYNITRGSATGWINTIAHRRAVDLVRSEDAARRRDVATERPDRAYDSVVEQVERSEDRAEVNASLDVLTDLQRETIQLSYFDGMTYHEIAIQLSVPVNTIKTRMRDGLTRLRDTYGGQR